MKIKTVKAHGYGLQISETTFTEATPADLEASGWVKREKVEPIRIGDHLMCQCSRYSIISRNIKGMKFCPSCGSEIIT